MFNKCSPGPSCCFVEVHTLFLEGQQLIIPVAEVDQACKEPAQYDSHGSLVLDYAILWPPNRRCAKISSVGKLARRTSGPSKMSAAFVWVEMMWHKKNNRCQQMFLVEHISAYASHARLMRLDACAAWGFTIAAHVLAFWFQLGLDVWFFQSCFSGRLRFIGSGKGFSQKHRHCAKKILVTQLLVEFPHHLIQASQWMHFRWRSWHPRQMQQASTLKGLPSNDSPSPPWSKVWLREQGPEPWSDDLWLIGFKSFFLCHENHD